VHIFHHINNLLYLLVYPLEAMLPLYGRVKLGLFLGLGGSLKTLGLGVGSGLGGATGG
jgi:hypothetical protein